MTAVILKMITAINYMFFPVVSECEMVVLLEQPSAETVVVVCEQETLSFRAVTRDKGQHGFWLEPGDYKCLAMTYDDDKEQELTVAVYEICEE